MSEPPAWAEHPDLVEFYGSHRNRLDELYPSERRFLPWLAAQAESVLDVGCGAGGFSAVWRAYGPALRYKGIDVSGPLVEAARAAHPEHEFLQADCAEGLPLPDRAVDVTAALGWLHWEPRYFRALAELWRVTRRYLFFDLRLTASGSDLVGSQRLALTSQWDGHTTVPYICAAWPRVAEELLALGPRRLFAHGYWGTPADTVMGVPAEACFATFVLQRGDSAPARPQVVLDLPMDWPAHLVAGVELGGPARLAELVPDAQRDAR
jgi:SAM-dependent methyltransferase